MKHQNILLWKAKISSDKDATRQARQSCQHQFSYNWSCPWAGEMDWLSSSWAVGRHWLTTGILNKAPGEFNLSFSLHSTFFSESSLQKSFEEFTLSQQDRRGPEASDLSIGHILSIARGQLGGQLLLFLAFPWRKWAELCWRLCYHSGTKSIEKADLSLPSEIQIQNWGTFKGTGCEEWCCVPGTLRLGSGRGRF